MSAWLEGEAYVLLQACNLLLQGVLLAAETFALVETLEQI